MSRRKSARCGLFSAAAVSSAGLAFGLLAVAGVAAAAEPALTARQAQGQKLYRSTCLYCHGPNVWGTFTLSRRLGADHALLEERKDIVAPYVKAVVRSGLGSMPAYRRTELADTELEAIADYLSRANPAK